MNNAKSDNKLATIDWVVSEKTITTKGGVYIGVAKNVECAKLMAASTRLLKLLQSKAETDPEIKKAIDAIFQDL